MLRLRYRRGWTAVPVAVLLWFASLTPLAAQWLTSSLSAACCRSKCCCHRTKHSSQGPAISERTCGAGCDSATFGSAASVACPPLPLRTWAPALPVSEQAGTLEQFHSSTSSLPQLQQRPPPIHLT